MNLHEYQAKQLIAKYGISVPKGIAIKSIDELEQSIAELESSSYVCLLYTSDAAERSTLCRSRWSPYH